MILAREWQRPRYLRDPDLFALHTQAGVFCQVGTRPAAPHLPWAPTTCLSFQSLGLLPIFAPSKPSHPAGA